MGLLGFGFGLVALGATTVLLLRAYGTGLGWLPLWALLRATVQLGVVALVLRGVLSVPWTVAAFVVLMLVTASATSGRRIVGLRHGPRIAALGIVAGAVPTIGAVFLLRLVEPDARYLIAVGGILIGNAMSASILAGRMFLRSARARVGEVEAWLSLGASPGRAYADVAREAVGETVLPSLDQTKATGLVTLPGAFVGALFGGASPLQAAQFQLVVLAGIGLTMTVTAVVVTWAAGRSPTLPA